MEQDSVVNQTEFTYPNAQINKSLSIAQGQFRTPQLNRSAKVLKEGRLLYETHYADLQECIDCIRKPLSDNGLSFVQKTCAIDEKSQAWQLVLVLLHSSGESLKTSLPLNTAQTPQQLGGTLTYLKRYQLSAFFGLAADFDDDGNTAEDKGNVVQASPKAKLGAAPQIKPIVNHAPVREPMTKLEKFRITASESGFTPEAIKEKMQLCLGYVKHSSELNDVELDQLMNFFRLSSGSR